MNITKSKNCLDIATRV